MGADRILTPAAGSVEPGWWAVRICSLTERLLGSLKGGLINPVLLHAQYGLPLGGTLLAPTLAAAVAAPEIRDLTSKFVGLGAAMVLGKDHSERVLKHARAWVYASTLVGPLFELLPLVLFFYPGSLLTMWMFQTCAQTLLGVFTSPASVAVFYKMDHGTSADPTQRAELKRVCSNQDSLLALLRVPLEVGTAWWTIEWCMRENGRQEVCAAFVVVLLAQTLINAFRVHCIPVDRKLGEEQKEKKDDTLNALWSLVLPRGYPRTVSDDYLNYQVYDTSQVVCDVLRGAIIGPLVRALALMEPEQGPKASSGSSILVVVGFGHFQGWFKSAIALAAGSLFTSKGSAERMKTWRMRGAVWALFASVVMTMDALAPGDSGAPTRMGLGCFRDSVGAVMGVLSGGAGESLILHLARHNTDATFAAEVAAKETNQDRVVGLLLAALRFGLMMVVGTDVRLALVLVVLLSIFHVWFNLLAMRALHSSKYEQGFSWPWAAVAPRGRSQSKPKLE